MVTIKGILKYYRDSFYYLSKLLETGSFGESSELLFWKVTLRTVDSNWTQPMHEIEVNVALDEIKKEFGVSGTGVKVLELGPGPRSRLTTGYDKGMFSLIAVDPLAVYYKREFNGREFLWPGGAEDIQRIFPNSYFDIVYASNSIDHSASPEEIIKIEKAKKELKRKEEPPEPVI